MVLVVLAIILTVSILSSSGVAVEAARVRPEEFSGHGGDSHSSMMFDKAKFVMASWFQRLDSGPSPSGPGH